MSKMGSHDPFGHSKFKLWLKEGSGVKLTIWFLTTKSLESPQFPCMQVACHIHWKTLDEGYNFVSDLTSIEALHTKLWAPKGAGVVTLRILRPPLESLETKWHLGAGHVLSIEYTIRWKVMASPKSGPWWVL
jgi:hypothetical protein